MYKNIVKAVVSVAIRTVWVLSALSVKTVGMVI